MSNKDEDLNTVETLLNEGRDFEVIPILNKLKEKRTFNLSEEVFLSSLLIRIADWENTVKIAEQAYKKAQKVKYSPQIIQALLNQAYGLIRIGNLEESSKLLEKSEVVFKELTNNPSAKLEELKAYQAYIKGTHLFFLGNKEETLNYYKKSLELRKRIGNKRLIAESFLGLSNFYRLLEMDFEKAFNYANKCLEIGEEIHDQRLKASAHFNLGSIYYFKGELEKGLSYYKFPLEYFEKINDTYSYLGIMNNLALIYRAKGELDTAIGLLDKCIKLSENSKNNWMLVGYNVGMVELSLDKGELEKAKEHSERVKELLDIEKTPYINRDYNYTQALILKKSPRVQNRAKAENLLRTLIQDDDTVFEIKIEGLIHLCDLLIDELKITSEMEIIKEIKPLIRQLLLLTEKSKSYWYYTQTYVLQAKLSLLTLDIKNARKLLTKAQYIAQNYGFDPLVKIISREHDNLLQKLDIWEKIKDSESPLTDRLKLTNLDEQITLMIQKRRVEVPEVIEEEPIMILVISEAGIPTFSKLFAESFLVEDELISSFLAAFNTFSGELFSEGLERASFGNYTLIMKPIVNFLVCYLFKGQSYSAQKRIEKFIEEIERNKEVLDKFNEYRTTNRMIKLENLPKLNSLIKHIFLNE